MKIQTRVNPYNKEGSNVKAYADVMFDDCFVIKDARIMEGKNGLFVGMPSKQVSGKYKETCHPITKEFKQELDDAVLSEYKHNLNLNQEVQRDEQEETTQERSKPQDETEEPKQEDEELPDQQSRAGRPDKAQDGSIKMEMSM